MSKFSILMANWNNANHLPKAVASCLEQTWQDLEIIILDDASSDESKEIIRDISEWDPRIRTIFHDTNKGIGYTKRSLITHSQGAIFGFLDPDDYLSRDAVEVMVNAHRANPDAGLIYSKLVHIDESGNVTGESRYNRAIPEGESFLTYGGISAFATMKRSFYEKTEGMNPMLRIAEDQDLYLKMEEVSSVEFIDRVLYYYRNHPGSISLNHNVTRAHVWQVIARYEAYKRRGLPIDEAHLIAYFVGREEKYRNFYNAMYNPSRVLMQLPRAIRKWIVTKFQS